jgi:hypothetical protein
MSRWAATFAMVMVMATAVRGVDLSQEAATVFAAQRDTLLQEGVHRVGGFVFASVPVERDSAASSLHNQVAEGEAELRAIEGMLAFRIREQFPEGLGTHGLREAAVDVAVSCLGGPMKFAGLLTVEMPSESNGFRLVKAVPAGAIDAVSFTRDSLLTCLRERVDAGKASLTEAIVLYELDTPEGERVSAASTARFVSALTRLLGPGIAPAVSGEWTMPDGAICPEAVSGWSMLAASTVRKTGSIGDSLTPLSKEQLAALSVDDLFELIAVRVHDSAVLQALAEGLRASGFVRTAEFANLKTAPLHEVRDRPSERLGRQLRANVVSLPIVTTALLTGGALTCAWSQTELPWLGTAVAAFDEGTPESLNNAIALLVENIGTPPSHEAVVLLSAALLAVDEPALAEPLARATFFAKPSHRFAGINALRAAKALDARDRANELYPRVIAAVKPDASERRALEQIATWLGVPPPPSDVPPAPPPEHGKPS